MRGGFLHNHVLLAPMERKFLALGGQVTREHLVREGDRQGAIDLFVRFPHTTIACEAELGLARIKNDVWKANVANAKTLLIVTPNSRVAATIRIHVRVLIGEPRCPMPRIWVLPLGIALQWLPYLLSFYDSVDCQAVRNHQSIYPPRER